ncbi:MAG: CpaF family protein [Steroidobacteraceae bacterium]
MRLSDDALEAIHQELIRRLDLRRNDIDRMPDHELRALAQRHLGEVLGNWLPADAPQTRELEQQLLREVVGLGVIEDLLGDEHITEIMINGPGEVFVERQGRLQRCNARFSSRRSLGGVIERLLQGTGRRIDESSPMVDARLPDGSRVNIIVPPLALAGAAITIRKFGRGLLGMPDLLAAGALSSEMAGYLACAIRQRRNIVVSGGTGSGKTTLLNCLSALIPPGERVITIEDSAELRLQHQNLVRLEARPANAEGRGLVTIRDLVRNALRMRPDRIVVGECRGGEALDMLQAMNTGHDGSLTTAHANSPRDLLSRLEVMVLMAGMDLPLLAVREQIAAAVQVVVQLARSADGTRRVVQIAEITGTEAGRIQMQELFRHESACGAGCGRFVATGNLPVFLDGLAPQERPRVAALFDARSCAAQEGKGGEDLR